MDTSSAPSVISKTRALTYYTWGSDCEAWSLVDNEELSIKHEKMPPRAEEELHYHQKAQQFFHVLTGRAVFEVDEVIVIVHPGEGIYIEAGRAHKVMNKDAEDLEFMVISQPSTKNDRFNIV